MKPEKKRAVTQFHREQILRASEKLFEEKGFTGVTMDDIASKADYSKATLYVYFKNKNEIMNALTLRGMRMLRDRIGRAVRTRQDWMRAYDAVCEAVAGFYRENPLAYEATAGFINVDLEDPGTPAVFHEIFETGEEINRDMIAFVKRGEAEGRIHPQPDAGRTVFLFWAALSGIIRAAQAKADYLSRYLGSEPEEFLRAGFAMLLASIAAREDAE